jgi:hypothetical protein
MVVGASETVRTTPPTVTARSVLLDPAVAVMVAVPVLTAVTCPCESSTLVTLATDAFDEVHDTAAATATPRLEMGYAVTVCAGDAGD